ncbi:adenosylcobinamide-phosphate synthase CbiB [Kaistia terrae]|uniref:Cobalamin biosynthesis protein CobD n=1 Tax=Kaistia terrae TaxID=537017 RepID=A0ABW0Q1B2_9HYPH|nr:adenosylcobinamide-phosphate synthase CbiB [Kaistia terrae]MCX5578662.1 adenosylcobinamide-phosphate synthase CbiB [Kaistia terrae]
MTEFPFDIRLLMLIAAIALDALIGDPDWIWRRLPHPVTWFGALIGICDRTFNRETASPGLRRTAGMAVVIVLVAIAWFAGVLIERLVTLLPYGFVLIPVIASVLLASRSLYDHVLRVLNAFHSGGLDEARKAVSMIVGRDPDSLDKAGVTRAAIESTAENFSDGVVAPAFWFAVFGLPGLFAYKMINTADSMIGHRSTRHEAFGWAAARLDDLVNLPASRLAGFLIAMAAPFVGGTIKQSFVTMLDDARKHRSPNAGWPEAAMAGALGIALAGPRRYGERVVEDPFLNDGGRHEAGPGDIGRALKILRVATAGSAILTLIVWLYLHT